jgi:ABC-2 type transport system permease protein
MTTLAHATADSVTMFGRNATRAIRSGLVVYTIAMPLVILLLFVYVFGGTLGAGIVPGGGQQEYLAFVLPGILVFSIAGLMQIVAIAVSQDMTEGIIARFRSMSISRGAVHAGHMWSGVAQGAVALALTIALAVLMGFRPNADLVDWALIAALLLGVLVALLWLSVAIGTVAKTVESASNLPMPFLLLPFLGAGFVPTDSMPGWLRWFTDYQPFTPWIETLRGLLLGTEVTALDVALSIGWIVVLGGAGYVWSRYLYARTSVR